MEVTENLPPGDPKLVQNIVNHLKSKGIFDQFRRDCLADVDTRPAYQNLRQRVDGYVSKFLAQQSWPPELNKNQLRDSLRRQINESGMLAMGVDHLVEQVVNPKVYQVFYPHIESMVKKFLGLESSQAEEKQATPQKQEQNQQAQSSMQESAKSGQVKPALLPLPFHPPPPPPPPPPGIQDVVLKETNAGTENVKKEPKTPDELKTQKDSIPDIKDDVKQEVKSDVTPEPSISDNEKESTKVGENTSTSTSRSNDAQGTSDSIESNSEQKELVDCIKEEQDKPVDEAEPVTEDFKQLGEIVMEKKIVCRPVIESDDCDSLDSTSGSLTGRLVIDMKGYEREGTPSESNSRDSFKFSKDVKEKEQQLSAGSSSDQHRFSESSISCDSSLSKTETSENVGEGEDSASNLDADKGKVEEVSEKTKSSESARPKSSKSSSHSVRDSSTESSKSKSHGHTSKSSPEKSSAKTSGSNSGNIKKHSSRVSEGKTKSQESRRNMGDEIKSKSKDKSKSSSDKLKKTHSENKPKYEPESAKLKHSKISKSKDAHKGGKHKTGDNDDVESKSKGQRSMKGEAEKSSTKTEESKASKDLKNQRDSMQETTTSLSSKQREGKRATSTAPQVPETSEDENDQDNVGKCTDTSFGSSMGSERKDNSDSEEDKSGHGNKGSLGKFGSKGQSTETGYDSNSQQVEKGKESQHSGDQSTPESSEKESDNLQNDEIKHSECSSAKIGKKNTDKVNNEKHTFLEKDKDMTVESSADGACEDDARSISALSDVTVSSVHTSDLSSFDDEISLSSEDELKVALEKPTKKLSLREVKEMAKIYDNVGKNPCETEIKQEKDDKERNATAMPECPKTPDAKSSFSSSNTTPVKTSTEENSSPEFRSETKMSLRRERKINPKYASKEFSSIFTNMKRIRSTCNAMEESEALQPDHSRTASTNGRQVKRKRSSGGNDNAVSSSLEENGFHFGHYLNSEKNTSTEEPLNGILLGDADQSNSSTTPGNTGLESHVSIRKRIRSCEEKISKEGSDDKSCCQISPEVVKSARSTRLRSSSEHKSDIHSSQRYDSSDLYKPRPIISSKSRRSRGQMQFSSQEDDAISKENNVAVNREISEDSNSLDSLGSSHSRSSRKRGQSFSKQTESIVTPSKRKK